MHNQPASAWRAFVRHRYHAHMQGWLAVAVGLLWGYYIDLYAHEPLWAVLPAAFLAGFFVVAVLVAVAAVLRFPWWGLAPLAFASMAIEWVLRRLLKRPWRRRPQPRERALSNPFALWQGWRMKRRRQARRRSRQQAPAPARTATPEKRLRRSRDPFAWAGVGEYMAEAFEGHWKFWGYTSPLWIGLWLWLIEDMSFWAAAIVAIVVSLIFSVLLVIPLLAALLALVSTLLFAAGMTPQQRIKAAATLRLVHAAEAERVAPAPTPAAQKCNWLWPLLIGLWIGSSWGKDD